MTALTYSDINNYIPHLFKQNLKASTINRKIASIRAFYVYLVKTKIIKDFKVLDIVFTKEAHYLPVMMSEGEINRLITTPKATSSTGRRDRAMIELMYATGVRLSELVNLQLKNIDWNRSSVKILGKGNKERLIPFNDSSAQSLRLYINQKKEPNGKDVFLSSRGTKISSGAFWSRIKKYIKDAGLKSTISPHTIRHAFATHLLNNGADLVTIQLLLGHADISTTAIYTHIETKKLGEIHKKYHPRG